MRNQFILLLSLCAQPVVAQMAPAPVQVDSDKLHLLKQTQPLYPPIAIAAHQQGDVKLQVTIAPDGHVVSTKTVSGPPMLRGAANECVQEWIYAPTLDAAGQAEAVATVVTMTFDLKIPGKQPNQMLAWDYYNLQMDCMASIRLNEKPEKQVKACLKVVKAAEAFPVGERLYERGTAYFDYALALMHNQQPQEALEYIDKAMPFISPNQDDLERTANAYSVRAQAEAATGKLPQAGEDLAKSEQSLRQALDNLSPQAVKSFRIALTANLKAVLIGEAKLLTVEGKTAAASEKSAEAEKL